MAEMSTGVADAVVVEIEGFEDRVSQQSTISEDDGEEEARVFFRGLS